ncbi:MAG: cysteine--tRNA ligase [Planctomycetota bacterium]|jgi:cysteinyl-tRNA synthetase
MLKVYNSLGRELQEFKPLREGFVGIYVCGPTVYGDSHIGHAKSYVSFDVIVRYLRFAGYQVGYVQNITDVGHLTDDADMGEDKIGVKAREMGVQPMEVAETYTRSYFEDMDALNVRRPDISPRASGHIPEQTELVRMLLEKGHAYQVGGNVYFDVGSFPDYGKLSGRSQDDLMEGARVEARSEKRSPADFALWKRAEPGHIMRWDSPWGEGFPGWHLECSVMAQKYLGDTVDIHGGGIENIFPHHEDEVAQTEAATGRPFIRYWLHNGMVTVNGQKMGKSLGNFITLKDAFAGRPPLEKPLRPMVLRYFILTSHYRSPLDFSQEALSAAEKGLERIEQAVGRVRRALDATPEGDASEAVRELVERSRGDLLAEMDNDFNTAGAIGVLSTFTREVNRLLDAGDRSAGDLGAISDLYDELGGRVLGIVTAGTGERTGGGLSAGLPSAGLGAGIESELIEALLGVRAELREAGHYELADSIRDRLEGLGVEVKDGPDGTTWQ